MSEIDWKTTVVAGVLAGLGALAVILLLERLSISGMFNELAEYLRRRDDFHRYLEERDDDGDA